MKLNNYNNIINTESKIVPTQVELVDYSIPQYAILDKGITLSKLSDDTIDYINTHSGTGGNVKAVDVIGWKRVSNLVELYSLSDRILSESGNNTDNDAIGQQWYVTDQDSVYTLVNWDNRANQLGWQKMRVDERFVNVPSLDNHFTIDYQKVKNAYVVLQTNDEFQYIDILNVDEGQFGRILVIQNEDNKIVLNIKGEFVLPSRKGDGLLITYFKRNGIVYGYSEKVLQEGQYKIPQTINDFVVKYYDSTTVQLALSAPHGDLNTDSVSYYDMRYSNHVVDASDPKIWIGMQKVDNLPQPETPGTEQGFTITDFKPGTEYYIYLKSIQIIKGIIYESLPSDFAYCRTTSSSETDTKPYKINLNVNQIFVQNEIILKDAGITETSKMIDEASNDKFLDTNYIDTKNSAYFTAWQTFSYSRGTGYYKIIFDLSQQYAMDKIFIGEKGSGLYTVYGFKDETSKPELIGTNDDGVTDFFTTIQCNNKIYRFILIQCDRQLFCSMSNNPVITENDYGCPDPYYNYGIPTIYRILFYGKSVSGKPDKILPPYRKATIKKVMKDWLCSNGHFYQPGRLHSKVSGPNIRLYGHSGHFCAFNEQLVRQTFNKLSDFKYRLNRIPWVIQNSGADFGLRELLENTYKPYGLKPILTMTGTNDWVRLVWNGRQFNECAPTDGHCVQLNDPAKLPKNSPYGLNERLLHTANPLKYKIYARLAYALAAVYGKNAVANSDKFIWDSPDYPKHEPMDTGLDLLGGFEYDNEPDKTWVGVMNYRLPEEMFAALSAVYDGHENQIIDDLNESNKYGAHTADNQFQIIYPGLASASTGYVFYTWLLSKSLRTHGQFPSNCINTHNYCSNMWLNGGYQENQYPTTYAVPVETMMDPINLSGRNYSRILDVIYRYMPSQEYRVTEFGYGESGRRNGHSRLQCYSIPGRRIGEWVLPDKHRSDVKGSWIIRGLLQFLQKGIDQVNLYITYNDDSWFNDNGGGAGVEMFEWDKLVDGEPGEKVTAVEKYVTQVDKSGFSSFGLFGGYLVNGGYPISRSFWYIALFRNLLGDCEFLGKLEYTPDPKVMIYAFKKKNEEKGFYVVYYNDNQNNGLANVQIELPSQNTTANIYKEYIPKLVNPNVLNNDLGNDQLRTGLPTSRREKYINGSWVIQNPKWVGQFESFTQELAKYPTNPKEGDTVVVFPTSAENPYFPLVGPVAAYRSAKTGQLLGANQYEYSTINDQGNTVWNAKYNTGLSFRQNEAICDFIEYHPEGIRGRSGDKTQVSLIGNKVAINVTEFPQYIEFDGIPSTSFNSKVTDLQVISKDSSTLQLWWNNHNFEDTSYEIFLSSLPDSGYTLYNTITVGMENSCKITGLTENTTYYFKIRPKRNNDIGEFSDYCSGKTSTLIGTSTNLSITEQTATTVSLTWDYAYQNYTDFAYYAIYRASRDGAFALVGKIEDKTIKTFTDTGLTIGTNYTYKIIVYGLYGKGYYSDELQCRTLLPTEIGPQLKSATTDKLGTKILLEFDLEIQAMSANAKDSFTVTENGNIRFIKNIYRDNTNTKIVVLEIDSNSIEDYDQLTTVLVSYTKNPTYSIKSIYGIDLDSFVNKNVLNIIGNFTNIYATYKINLTSTTAALPLQPNWNNWISPNSGTIPDLKINDTYGRSSNITLSVVVSQNTNMGSIQDGLYQPLQDVEKQVQKTGWKSSPYSANITESQTGLIRITGLKNDRRYTIKTFGSVIYGTYTKQKLRVNNKYSNLVDQHLTSEYNVIEDCAPVQNQLDLYFINAREVNDLVYNGLSMCSFIVIEEFMTGGDPGIDELWLKTAVVNEINNEGVVKTKDVTVHLNVIGTATHCRITEDLANINSAPWEVIDTSTYNVPFSLSDNYEIKNLYVQIKNNTTESNIRHILLNYVDPYEPLALNNIYINSNKVETFDKNIIITLDKKGIPTHYKLSENSDLSTVQWIEFPTQVQTLQFTLSDTEGEKTLYCQLKDNLSTSVVRTDGIYYKPLSEITYDFSVSLDPAQNADDITIEIPKLKYNKKLIFSYITDDSNSLYQFWFSVINKRRVVVDFKSPDDGKFFYYHLGMDDNPVIQKYITSEYMPTKPLEYTDGANVRKRYTSTVAMWPDKFFVDDVPVTKPGMQNPWVSVNEAELYLDFGYSFGYHDLIGYDWATVTQETFNKNMTDTINRFNQAINYTPRLMVEPNGDHKYLTLSQNNQAVDLIVAQGGDSRIRLVYPHRTDFSIDKLDVVIQRIGAYGTDLGHDAETTGYSIDILNRLATMKAMTDDTKIYWLIGAAHTCSNWERKLIENINALYGADGDDSLWFTTLEEFYEYWFMKNNTNIVKVVSGNNIKFTITTKIKDGFRFLNNSFIIKGLIDPQNSIVTESKEVKGLSYAVNEFDLLVNIDPSKRIEDLSEKYVSYFENNQDDRYAYNDAIYFTQQLKPSLKTTFMTRIQAIANPSQLSLVTFTADGQTDADSTRNRDISVVVTTTGAYPKTIKVSENSDFSSSTDYSVTGKFHLNTIPFQLSDIYGSKTVYVKAINQYGDSNIINKTIQYNRPDPVVINNIVIQNGALEHEGYTVSTRINLTSGIATHYAVAETEAELNTAPWKTYSDTFDYTFDTSGNKTLYVKVKNSASESLVVNDSIIITIPKLSVVLGFNGTVDNTVQNVTYNNDVTNQIRTSFNAGWAIRTLKDKQGNSTNIRVVFNNSHTTNICAPHTRFYNGEHFVDSSTTDNGIYPKVAFNKSVMSGSYAPNAKSEPSVIPLILPMGTYEIKILMSVQSNLSLSTEDMRLYCRYGAIKDKTLAASSPVTDNSSFTGVANNQYNSKFTLNVPENEAQVNIIGYASGPGYINYRPGMNLIEITKID